MALPNLLLVWCLSLIVGDAFAIRCFNATHQVHPDISEQLPQDAYIIDSCECCSREVYFANNLVHFKWGCDNKQNLGCSGSNEAITRQIGKSSIRPKHPHGGYSSQQSAAYNQPQLQASDGFSGLQSGFFGQQQPARNFVSMQQQRQQQLQSYATPQSNLPSNIQYCKCCTDLCNKQMSCIESENQAANRLMQMSPLSNLNLVVDSDNFRQHWAQN